MMHWRHCVPDGHNVECRLELFAVARHGYPFAQMADRCVRRLVALGFSCGTAG